MFSASIATTYISYAVGHIQKGKTTTTTTKLQLEDGDGRHCHH